MTRIVDTHVHLWRGASSNPWVEGDPDFDREWLPDHLDDVVDSVFVEAGAHDGIEEARWVNGLDWPDLRGIVAAANVDRGHEVAAELVELKNISRVVGVRRLLQDEPLEFFERPELLTGLREVAAAGLTFDACVRHNQVKALTRLLSAIPELDVVLDHLGKPDIGSGDITAWSQDLLALSRLPRVHVKLSGMAPESDVTRPLAPQARPALLQALEAFGPERAMLGSDWPVSAAPPNWPSRLWWFSFVLDEFGLTSTERMSVASGTADSFYRLARD